MGDRYIADVNCAYCGATNEEVWYAPTCGADTFRCEKCGKQNFIYSILMNALKMEDVTVQDVIKGFEECTSISWSEEEVWRMCEEYLNEIKKLKDPK